MIAVHQIYFDDKTQKHLEPEFIPYFNDIKDGYFENTVIKNIYDKINDSTASIQEADKYIGISSWKQRSKTGVTGAEIFAHIRKDVEAGIEKDVYIYTPTSKVLFNKIDVPEGYDMNGVIKARDIWDLHKGWGKQVYHTDVLLNSSKVLPFNMLDGNWVYSHCNYWIAKKEIFNEYCEKVLIPAIQFFERPDIQPTLENWYTHMHEGRSCNSCSFVMEGLFGAFLAHNDYSYSYICKKRVKGSKDKRKRKFKKINILRYERT